MLFLHYYLWAMNGAKRIAYTKREGVMRNESVSEYALL